MEKLLKRLKALAWPATIIAVAIIWAYSSFATIAYVDNKHAGVMEVLNDIRERVKTIDDRTFELANRKH